MLPEIPVDASEREVHTYIRDTIKNAEDSLSGCLLSDFEYVEAHGKNLCVPAQQSDFEWTGRAVKELAGSGSIYVRLTTENVDLRSPNSDYSVGSLWETRRSQMSKYHQVYWQISLNPAVNCALAKVVSMRLPMAQWMGILISNGGVDSSSPCMMQRPWCRTTDEERRLNRLLLLLVKSFNNVLPF